jgi:hypothetical protein
MSETKRIKIDCPRFLFSTDPLKNELYILHRNFPHCLILVKDETPVRFVIVDVYDNVEVNEILKMDFINDAKDFYEHYSDKLLGK